MADNDGNLLISFLRCPRQMDERVSRSSPNIKPFGSCTDDWEWRFSLKTDDTFDCCDEYGLWYKSTVLGVDEQPAQVDIDGNSIPRLHVAFRFADPYGAKEDDKGRKFTGWMA